MYCPNCYILFDEPRCPSCGRKKVRAPQENDPCYLITKDHIWSGVLEDILRQNDIPYYKQGALGAGLTAKFGSINEHFRFYVPYACLEKAKELCISLFAESDA